MTCGSFKMDCRPLRAIGQHGQALTEFLVVASALIPLFLIVPLIAKYQDIAHATQMASRYVAFDHTVRNASQNSAKPLSQLQDEVRRRFFGNSRVPIKTKDVAGDFKADQNLFWRTPDDESLIASFSDVTVALSEQKTADEKPPFAFLFGATGIRTAQVNVKLANLPEGLKFYEPFDRINLSMNRITSVLFDGWTGKDPMDVQKHFEGMVPATKLVPPLSTLLNPVMQQLEPGVAPPKLGDLDFWRDDVPIDRLRSP